MTKTTTTTHIISDNNEVRYIVIADEKTRIPVFYEVSRMGFDDTGKMLEEILADKKKEI